MRILVVIPTYNEKDNIRPLILEILKQAQTLSRKLEILVVDDNSPDGTGKVVTELNLPEVHLLTRAKKSGLGRAYLAGFDWALKNNFDLIFEMDADFSHRPQDLLSMIVEIKDRDFVIGSRYVAGGATQNWGFFRKLISKGGGIYSRLILGFPVRDWTGGFNGWTRRTLEGINLPAVQSEGYSFQIELKYRALKNGFHGFEFPIVFEDRRVGKSKMSLKIVLEAFYRVWLIRFKVV